MGPRIRTCLLCKNTQRPLFELPNNFEVRFKWLDFLQSYCDLSRIKDYTVLCRKHFDSECIIFDGKKHRLNKGAVPTICDIPVDGEQFVIKTEEMEVSEKEVHITTTITSSTQKQFQEVPVAIINNFLPIDDEPVVKTVRKNVVDKCVQVGSISFEKYEHLKYQRKLANLRVKRLLQKCTDHTTEIMRLREQLNKHAKEIRLINKIKKDAENCDKAHFLLSSIQNYLKKQPRWSRRLVEMCSNWRAQASKGYDFCKNNVLNLPSRKTILRVINGQNKNTLNTNSPMPDALAINLCSPSKEEGIIETEVICDYDPEGSVDYEFNINDYGVENSIITQIN